MVQSIALPGSRGRRLIVVGMALTMTLVASGVADAALTYSNTTRIYACVNKLTKVARIVTPRNGHTACRSGEAVVSWMKAGVTGAAGPTGLQGPAGANGTRCRRGRRGPSAIAAPGSRRSGFRRAAYRGDHAHPT